MTRSRLLRCLVAWLIVILPWQQALAISTADERSMGARFQLEARRTLPLIDDIEVTQYAEKLLRPIVAHLDDRRFDYQIAIVRDGRINAFAVPGGYLYLNAGLLAQAANDDEIAGVLGHEVAHVQARHLARQEEKSRVLNYASLAGLALSVILPPVGAGAIAAASATRLQYQRDFEQEADFLGARYMRAGGFQPRGMLDFFKRLEETHGAASSLLPPYLQSHPLSKDRLTNLEAVLRERQWQGSSRPSTAELERIRLLVRLELDPKPEVVRDYRRNAERSPGQTLPAYLAGLAHLLAGQAREASEIFARLEGVADLPIERERGRAALLERRLDDAKQFLEKAAARGGDAIAWRDLGRTREALRDSQGALEAYRNALAIAPESAEIHRSAGVLAGRIGDAGAGYLHLAHAARLRGEYESSVGLYDKAAAAFAPQAQEQEVIRQRRAEIEDFLAASSFFGGAGRLTPR